MDENKKDFCLLSSNIDLNIFEMKFHLQATVSAPELLKKCIPIPNTAKDCTIIFVETKHPKVIRILYFGVLRESTTFMHFFFFL